MGPRFERRRGRPQHVLGDVQRDFFSTDTRHGMNGWWMGWGRMGVHPAMRARATKGNSSSACEEGHAIECSRPYPLDIPQERKGGEGGELTHHHRKPPRTWQRLYTSLCFSGLFNPASPTRIPVSPQPQELAAAHASIIWWRWLLAYVLCTTAHLRRTH